MFLEQGVVVVLWWRDFLSLSSALQVKHFLVVKLRECEAALLATARERDDLEETLRQLGSSLQEKEAEREEALQALQAHSQQQQV